MCVCVHCPTSRVPAKDEFSDLIVNKDEETVRECAEPPAGPGLQTMEVISWANSTSRNHHESDG